MTGTDRNLEKQADEFKPDDGECQMQVQAPWPSWVGILSATDTQPCGAPATHVLGLTTVCGHIPPRPRLRVCERHARMLNDRPRCDTCQQTVLSTEAVHLRV